MITEDECRSLLAGDTEWMKEHPNELVRELYAKMSYQRLRPRLMVSYLREPYIYPAGNVRVTFDSGIRTSLFTREFLSEQASDISATDMPQDMILEVKYDAFLPEIIQDIIQADGIRQQPSFSGVPDRPGGVSNMKNLITYGICLVVMLAALILAARFRRRKTK